MSIHPSDYVDSYFKSNRAWIEDKMLSTARKLEANGVSPVMYDLYDDGYILHGAVEDLKDDIMRELEWELEDLVQQWLDEIAERVMQCVRDNPESEED